MQHNSISSFITTLVVFVIILFSSFVGFVVISEILNDIENFKVSETAIINHGSNKNKDVSMSVYKYEHPVNLLNIELCEINRKTFDKLDKQLSCIISGMDKLDINNPIYVKNVDIIDIYESYFLDKEESNLILVDGIGNIIIDTKEYFGESFPDFKDSSNDLAFKQYIKFFEYKDTMKFYSHLETKDGVKIMFTYMKPILDNKFYLGISIFSDEYHNEIINKIVKRMELSVSNELEFSGYKIINEDGYVINCSDNLEEKVIVTKNKIFEKSKLQEYKKEWYKNKWNQDTIKSQVIRYTFVPSMDWFIYYELNEKNHQNNLFIEEILEKKHRVLNRIICLLLVSILVILILAFIIVGKFTKKINSQMDIINNSIIRRRKINLDEIVLSEFNNISCEVNELIEIVNSKIEVIEKPITVKKQMINEEYLLNVLQFAFLNLNNLHNDHSEFVVNEVIKECLYELKNIKLSICNIELVCDDYLKINSNKNVFMGIIKLFVSDLLILNTDLINNGVITIEIIGDEKLVYISISRDLSIITPNNIEFNSYEKLDEIHDIIEKYSNGLLDYNEYEFSSKKILIKFPQM